MNRKIFAGYLAMLAPLLCVGQVKMGTVQVGGGTVEQQQLTISCPAFNSETGRPRGTDYLLTLHLANTSQAVPVQAHGYFDWTDNKWYSYESLTSNSIVFFANDESGTQERDYEVHHTIVTQFGTLPGGTEHKTSTGGSSCYKWTKQLDRNTLAMEWTGVSTLSKDTAKSTYSCNGAPEKDLQVKLQCQLVQYREPPMRIGF